MTPVRPTTGGLQTPTGAPVAVGYLLDIDIWQSGATRIMQDGSVVKGLAPKPLDP